MESGVRSHDEGPPSACGETSSRRRCAGSYSCGGRVRLEPSPAARAGSRLGAKTHASFSRARVSREELVPLRYEVATWSGGFHDLRPGPGGGWNDPPAEKLCSGCEQWLPLDQFRSNPRLRTGLNSWCEKCGLERTCRWRAERPEAEEKYNAERRARYRAEHPRTERDSVQCGRPFTGRPDRIVCSFECRQARAT